MRRSGGTDGGAREPAMPNLKIASWNIEWMNDWFAPGSGPAAFRPTFTRDGLINDTHTTAQRAADLILALDADLLALQEAASRQAEVDLFIQTYLSNGGIPRYQAIVGDSGSAQKLALLWKPGSVASVAMAPSPDIQYLLDPWQADVDGDTFLDEYQFTRQPLVVNVIVGAHPFQVIVMHTKSNFVNNGAELWNNPASRQQYVVEALKARRRNSAECFRVRHYLDRVLDAATTARLIVVGDLNDGPGQDYFEEFYLTHSVTDILVGTSFAPERIFRHAQHDESPEERYSAVFDDFVENVLAKRLLLDHILLSPGFRSGTGLRRRAGTGAVGHAAYQALVEGTGQRRQDRPSDHRPVSVGLRY
jgi:endonuclease/exonuclease/phosphatase family metal-dependent hydrolase